MAKRGRPTVSSPSENDKQPSFVQDIVGNFVGAVCAAIIGLLFLFLLAFVVDVAGPILPSMPASVPSMPASVPQTSSQTTFNGYSARFESAAGNVGKGISLVLADGSYELVFEQVASKSEIQPLQNQNVFLADFRTGMTKGDINNADTFILHGNINLTIEPIGSIDHLQSNITTHGKNVSAYVYYAQSPRGPPKSRKRIFVNGSIKEINLPASFGDSTKDIRILDLGRTTPKGPEAESFGSRATYSAKTMEKPTQSKPKSR